jgi:hypothetical protein
LRCKGNKNRHKGLCTREEDTLSLLQTITTNTTAKQTGDFYEEGKRQKSLQFIQNTKTISRFKAINDYNPEKEYKYSII